MDEELEQPKNKITISSFFESIASVEKVANNALSIANSNLNIIQEQKSLIDALSLSIEGLRSDIQEINNYITIEKNEASDKLVETQDDKQKQMISERLQGLQGEKGEKGEEGASTSNPNESASERLKNEVEEKRQLKKFVNEVIDEREEKKENERKDELREKEDAEQKKEQSEKLQSKSEVGQKATVGTQGTFDEGGSTGGQGGQGGGEKKKKGLFSLLKNPLALGIGALGVGGALLSLPKMLGASLFGGGMGMGMPGMGMGMPGMGMPGMGGAGGIGGALKKMFGGEKDGDKERKGLFGGLFGGKKLKRGKVEETGTGKDKKDKKGITPYDFVQEKGLKVTDVEDGFNRMVHVYNPDVQDKEGNYQGIKVSGTFKKKDQVSTEQFVNAHEGFEVEKLKKIAKDNRKKENKLMDFVKKGGVAGFLGRKLFGGKEDEKKDDSKKLTTKREKGKVVGGTASQEQSDLMKRSEEIEMLIDAEYETGGKINYDKIAKLEKEQDEIENKLFNLDDKDSVQPEKKKDRRGILGMIGGGVDKLTGNLTDFDKRGGKTFGSTRVATGMADFFTADMFDLDKRGKMDLFGMRKKMKNKRAKEAYENNPRVKNSREMMLNRLDPTRNFEVTTGDGKVLKKGDEGFEEEYKKSQELFKKMQKGNFSLNSVVESKEKNVNQETLSSPDTSSPQIIMMPGANQESTNNNAIAPPPSQVKVGELKSTSSSSSFVHTISNNVIASAKKNKNLPPQIAAMIK